MTLSDALDFAELLDVLGSTPDEYIAVCHRVGTGPFHTAIDSPANASHYVGTLPPEADVFFSVNPVRGPARSNRGRGSAADVTRLAALVVDLDAKANGCGSIAVAEDIITDVAALIGEYPSVVVRSGYGLHGYWPVEDGQISDDFTTGHATAMLRRWGRLVRVVASNRNANVDSVFDLSRVLRVPGTANHKPVSK
ncbi:MAG: hypothetical protein ACSLE6_06470 [Mycobacterium sp.]